MPTVSTKDGIEIRTVQINDEPRFAIADARTGEILDDAQGYGYKSRQKAHAAWGWKNRSPEKIEKEKRILAWYRKNKKFSNALNAFLLDTLKDNEKISDDEIIRTIEEFDLSLPDCTIKEFRKTIGI